MSVQAGLWNFNGKPADGNLLARMANALAEYGPDGETTYSDGPVGMVYLPFHTTSESRLERQPRTSASGKVMTWDGRLDNRDELIGQLYNHLAAERTDLAIVEDAFERWGTDCFAKLIGDWALTIWDPRNRELTLARDYAGARHLFYYLKAESFIWSTHLEPLALCGDQFTLCEEYLAGYLASWPEAHLTPYREIHSVSPGTFIRVHNGKISIHPYWTFNPGRETRYKTDAQYEEHFRHLFRQAVRQRLRSDSPILADLSGGLDSSAVVCMADDILAKEGAETPSLDTFSILALDEPGEDDSLYLTKVEERRGRIGHHAVIQELSTSPFECAHFAATPIVAGRPEMNAAKFDVIRRGKYRVLLSGSGGDEMLGQALDPRVQLADLLRQFRFTELAKRLRVWSLLLRRPWIHLFLDAALLQLPVSVRAWTTGRAKVPPWVNRRFARRQKLSARLLDIKEGSWAWLPSGQDWFCTLTTLARGLTKVHPSREETRYPYRDQKLIEFLVSIPTEQLLRPGDRRSLMRRALAGLLPPEILARRTKTSSDRYFSAALTKYWGTLEPVLRASFVSRFNYVNQNQFYNCLVDVKHGNMTPHSARLSKALSLELWLQDVSARRLIAVEPKRSVTVGTDLAQSRV